MRDGRSTGGNDERMHPAVLVADDDVAHRRGVREALEARGFVIAAESGDAEAAIGAATRLLPDILLIEVDLPGDGLNAIGRISRASPKTLIVVLSQSARPDDVVTAFTRGASGYLLKGISSPPPCAPPTTASLRSPDRSSRTSSTRSAAARSAASSSRTAL
jgi:DNA-binding NarL/FixJ family response regulator